MQELNCPFIDYVNEDKSIYPLANTDGFIDLDDDFLIGTSGGFLMKIDFIFKGVSAFSEVAEHYTKYNCYTFAEPGTASYSEFWSRETKRRRKGMVLNCKLPVNKIGIYNALPDEDKHKVLEPLRITGEHYNYLNYGRIERTPSNEEKQQLILNRDKRKKLFGFPRFWDGDYWNFKADEFISNNGFNLCKGKARRKGYSYKRGSQGANTLNLNPNVTIVLAAYDYAFLVKAGKTTDMLKRNLDWYELNTYWKRGYLSEDYKNLELGYKKSDSGNKKFGWRSKALSVSLQNDAGATAGTDILEVDYEESGVNPVLIESLNITTSATEAGDTSTGTIRVYGTGGQKEADWEGFATVYYKPDLYNMMPLENIWDNNARHTVCGFFHPQIWNYEPFMDIDGNSDLVGAWYRDAERKADKAKTMPVGDWIIYVGQRANSPSEAFRTGGENMFSSPELTEHITRLTVDTTLHFWRDGMVVRDEKGVTFKTNTQLFNDGNKIHPYIESVPFTQRDDVHGCIREFYPPFYINGEIPRELYYITMDTIGKDKVQKEITVKNSLNCIQVWMYPNNISNSPGDILVAAYVGRTSQMEDADRIADLLCDRYNAKCLPEVDRGATVANFRKWNKLNKLYKDPTSIISEKYNPEGNSNYGIVIGATGKKEDGLLYVKDFLYTPVSVNAETGATVYNLHYIRDLPFLKELQIYNSKGNFDRISTAIVAMYQRMAYRTIKRKPSVVKHTTVLANIGMYDR